MLCDASIKRALSVVNMDDNKQRKGKRRKIKHKGIIKWNVDTKYRKSCMDTYVCLLSIECVQQYLKATVLSKIIAEYASCEIRKCTRYRFCRKQFLIETNDKGNTVHSNGFYTLTKKRYIVCNDCAPYFKCSLCSGLDRQIQACYNCHIQICRQCKIDGYIDEEEELYLSEGSDQDRFQVNLCGICSID